MEEAAVSGARQTPRGSRRAEIGLALVVVLAFLLALLISLIAQVLLDGPASGGTFVVLGVFAAPLVILLIIIAASLKTYSRRVRWAVAALFLLGVPLVIFSGALSWLLNTM